VAYASLAVDGHGTDGMARRFSPQDPAAILVSIRGFGEGVGAFLDLGNEGWILRCGDIEDEINRLGWGVW
jgi:hypothetical protein